jgi:hypothetical protein
MRDELCNFVVDRVVESEEVFGAKISMAKNHKLAKLHGGSFSHIVADSVTY